MFSGCYTALITPMKKNMEVDFEGVKSLVEFQVEEGVSGIVVIGTTGESPTLTWVEHEKVIEKAFEYAGKKCVVIAGTGSNSTQEALEATKHLSNFGLKNFLLVDPYYNGPSSLEIRREYIEPIAKSFPEAQIIPYIIPGRTGTQLLPQDLAILHKKLPNVNAVKEATGNFENMKLTRKLCGADFDILSGDDDKTYQMILDPEINASGVISVVSNIVPKAVQEFVEALRNRNIEKSNKLLKALNPLFQIVTVKTDEETSFGVVSCRARNPLPYKTLMNILGMPAGPCRPPLGKLTKKALNVVLNQVKQVYAENPEILQPIESFFDVKLEERLNAKKYLEGLYY
ncbi:MAG: 4-hydroxy-tetrahydrodipicolinate synthase, partial [Candidatus Bathyarchaeota archaeon]|nr:4-hydroxy-tetrahydrodipicolinate synthase [Candidatus Bathyarchaeota archaeon]